MFSRRLTPDITRRPKRLFELEIIRVGGRVQAVGGWPVPHFECTTRPLSPVNPYYALDANDLPGQKLVKALREWLCIKSVSPFVARG